MLDTHQPLDVVASTAALQRRSMIAGLALRQNKEEKWPQLLIGTLRLVKSTWSLSSSWSSDTPEPESECAIVRHTVPSTPPPSYSDPSHPWAEELQNELLEEQDKLPPYECTVSRVGHVYVKRERESQTTMAKQRSWKNLYVMLWGTSIRAYKREPKHGDERPVWSYSMHSAEAGMATDYSKYKHVLRIRTSDGPQFLMRCTDERSAVLWIDAVQASANVSPDLDTRPMPEFAFARRRRIRRRA